MNRIIRTNTLFLLIAIGSTTTHATTGIQTFEQQFFHNNPMPFPFPDIYPINSVPIDINTRENHTRTITKKPWTFMVYIAADNDLRAFAANNIKQMASIGSNNNVNIVIHLDIRLNGNQKITRRYYVEKNKITPIDQQSETRPMDSGDPKTLISFCEHAIKQYPAQSYALILWNHGTGIIDPRHYKIINPADLFMFNPKTNKLELDRSTGFIDLLSYKDMDRRGVCIDSTTGNYLTNQKLESALHEIYTRLLHNKKLSLIGFDACLMSMIEIANISKEYANIMIGSQEVELGTGWNYARVLQPLASNNIDCATFAHHIVTAYQDSYHQITNDFTQSAVNLTNINLLEQNIHSVALLLIECLLAQKNNSVRTAIKLSRNKKVCTSFDEPSYTDLHHFYKNLQSNLSKFLMNTPTKNHLINKLNLALTKGNKLILASVLANVAGKNLKMARGLSIYFPETRIHSSYLKTNFAKKNAWLSFLSHYLQQKATQ